MISRFEKAILIILAGLGACYWGYGLMLALTIPYEYSYPTSKWFLFVIEMVIPIGIFLSYGLAILKKRIQRGRTAWPLFFAVLVFTILFTYLFETLFGPTG